VDRGRPARIQRRLLRGTSRRRNRAGSHPPGGDGRVLAGSATTALSRRRRNFFTVGYGLRPSRPARKELLSLAAGKVLLKARAELLEEIAKCDIVCANCHAVRTYEWVRANKATLGWFTAGVSPRIDEKRAYSKAHTELLAKLREVPCLDCRRRFPFYVMQFDHRDGTKKRYTVSQMISRAGTKTILAEVAKCDIVCANCHRDRTYRRRLGPAGVA
jgi:hypothetical protein